MTPTTKEIIAIVTFLHAQGMTYTEIAKRIGGIHRATVANWVSPSKKVTRLSPVYLQPLRALQKKCSETPTS